ENSNACHEPRIAASYPHASAAQPKLRCCHNRTLELDDQAAARLIALEIDQIQMAARLVDGMAGNLCREGRLDERARQKSSREGRPDEQGLAFELIHNTPLQMAEVAHLRPKKVTRSHLAGDGTG